MEILTSRTIVHPTDLDRSIDFYGRALGLAVARGFGQGEGRGVVFFAGGGLIEVVAGRGAAGPTERVGPTGTPVALWLQVRSAEAALAELAERGVPVVRPARLEPWGLVEAWIDDPDGLRIHLVEVPPDHPLRRDTRGISRRRAEVTGGPHRIEGIDHVQLAMPAGPGAEDRAQAFFEGLLGLPRVSKPPELAARGGCWFERGPARVHLGVEQDFRPARKAHPALVVANLDALLGELERAGHPVRRAEEVPGRPQWYVDDPFGNRIELIPA